MTEQSLEQIRRRILVIARLNESHHQNGFVPAAIFTNAKDDNGSPEKLTDEQTQEQIDWLLNAGLLDAKSVHSLGGNKPSFRHQAYKLSRKGYLLWLEEIGPIPGVADDRLEA